MLAALIDSPPLYDRIDVTSVADVPAAANLWLATVRGGRPTIGRDFVADAFVIDATTIVVEIAMLDGAHTLHVCFPLEPYLAAHVLH
jgi:hypothetical protein